MLINKFKEVAQAVIPITIIVLLIHFFFVPLTSFQLTLFVLGALLVLVGLGVFLLGVDLSVNLIGQIMGRGLAKKKNLLLLAFGGIAIGFIISIAEPSLIILGEQISTMSQNALSQIQVVVVVSIGVAIFMSLGLFRIVFQWNISLIITIFYGIIFLLSLFSKESFLAFAFDSSGATTGALTVPFMLAMSSGIATLSSGADQSEEYNFGLVGITSIGPIIAMLFLGLLSPMDLSGEFSGVTEVTESIPTIIWQSLCDSFLQVIFGIIPLLLIFILYHLFIERQKPQVLKDILVGLLYLMIGLILFLTGVSSGFMPIGRYIGSVLSVEHNHIWVVLIGFTLGVVAILAEPAIYVLIEQIEDVSGGAISKKVVLFTIAGGVGSAIALTVIRIFIPDLRLGHILLVGFLLIVIFSWIVPKLFVAIAFDSGGTASGPMTGTFIFAFIQGIAIAYPTADPILDGFGMIAVVAMTPILFIEILGLVTLIVNRFTKD